MCMSLHEAVRYAKDPVVTPPPAACSPPPTIRSPPPEARCSAESTTSDVPLANKVNSENIISYLCLSLSAPFSGFYYTLLLTCHHVNTEQQCKHSASERCSPQNNQSQNQLHPGKHMTLFELIHVTKHVQLLSTECTTLQY